MKDKKIIKKNILITGNSGRLGKLLFSSLENEKSFNVIGADQDHKNSQIGESKIQHHHDPIENIFQHNNIHTVIHLDLIHDPREDWAYRNLYNITRTNHLLQLSSKYKIKKFIFLSTANLYGPSPKNTQLMSENEPLLATAITSGPDDLVKTDLLVSSFFWRAPDIDIIILRPCHIVGPFDNGISHYLRMKRPVTLLGFDPMIQLIHVDDLIFAIKLCLKNKIKGIFNLKGPGEISLHHILEGLGKNPRTLPTILAKSLISTLWSLQLTHFPPYELPYLQYSCMVDDSFFKSKISYNPEVNFQKILTYFKEHNESYWYSVEEDL